MFAAMAKIDMRSRRRFGQGWQPEVGELRALVWVCTTVERPDMNVSTIVQRPGVIKVHARIRPLRGDRILDYQAVLGTEKAPTYEITVRMPPDVKVDLNHWIYQEEGDYAKKWFKVRSTEDMGGRGRFLLLLCSLDKLNDERSDPATQESPPRWREPDVPRVVDRI